MLASRLVIGEIMLVVKYPKGVDSFRGDFAFDTYQLADASNRPIQNLIHASDSVENAENEINLWFKPDELYAWRRADEDLLYRKVEK